MGENRLSFIEYGAKMAMAAAQRSEDPHTKVGAYLAYLNTKRTVSTGYNGFLSGMEWPERFSLEENRAEKGEMMIHAEQNVFADVRAKDGPYALFLTISPCFPCSKLIVSKNVKEVYYLKEWHRESEKFKKVFDFFGIKYRELTKEEREKL